MLLSTRIFGWIALISLLHMIEQLLFGLDELTTIKAALARYYAHFGDADFATVLLVTIVLTFVSLLMFGVLVGGRARLTALLVFNVTALAEVHHVIETVAAGRYTPGLVTAIPYMIAGGWFLYAVLREHRQQRPLHEALPNPWAIRL